jgi:polysaccharide biosynthesis transport protein
VTDSHEMNALTLRDYLGVLWRRKWVMVAIVACATVGAYLYSARQTAQYKASASLIYEAPLSVFDPLSSSSNSVDPLQQQLDVQSVGTIVGSPDMQARVKRLVGAAILGSAPYTISGAAVQPNANSSYTNVATISAVSPDRAQAARIANAFARAFIAARKQRQQQQVRQAETVVASEMKNFTTATTRNSSDYILLEERLRDLQILEATVTGDFGLVAPATVPPAPFAPRPKRSALLGFGIGVLVAVIAAFVLEQLNTRLRDYREAAEILKMPVIGRIPSLPRRYLDHDGLTVVSHPDGRGAEAFRILRGNLEFVNVDDNARSILITSCKQGEGKSLTVANLAATLALAGKRVIVIDGDLRRPQMHKYFGLENEVGLSTVLSGQTPLATALRTVTLTPQTGGDAEASEGAAPPVITGSLRVLTSGTVPPNPGELIASRKFRATLDHLRAKADVVLIDSPAIMAVGDAGALAATVDGLVMLVNIQQVRRPTLREVCDVLEPLPCHNLGIIVTGEQFRSSESYRYAYYRYQQA